MIIPELSPSPAKQETQVAAILKFAATRYVPLIETRDYVTVLDTNDLEFLPLVLLLQLRSTMKNENIQCMTDRLSSYDFWIRILRLRASFFFTYLLAEAGFTGFWWNSLETSCTRYLIRPRPCPTTMHGG